MAPPSGTMKRMKFEVQQEGTVKKAASIISNVTTTTTTSRRASQPLTPSTSQNSVIKSTATKHKSRKLSQTKIERSITVKTSWTSKAASSNTTAQSPNSMYTYLDQDRWGNLDLVHSRINGMLNVHG